MARKDFDPADPDAEPPADRVGDMAYHVASGVARVARGGAYVTGGALLANGGGSELPPADSHLDSQQANWSQSGDPHPDLPSPVVSFPDLPPPDGPPPNSWAVGAPMFTAPGAEAMTTQPLPRLPAGQPDQTWMTDHPSPATGGQQWNGIGVSPGPSPQPGVPPGPVGADPHHAPGAPAADHPGLPGPIPGLPTLPPLPDLSHGLPLPAFPGIGGTQGNVLGAPGIHPVALATPISENAGAFDGIGAAGDGGAPNPQGRSDGNSWANDTAGVLGTQVGGYSGSGESDAGAEPGNRGPAGPGSRDEMRPATGHAVPAAVPAPPPPRPMVFGDNPALPAANPVAAPVAVFAPPAAPPPPAVPIPAPPPPPPVPDAQPVSVTPMQTAIQPHAAGTPVANVTSPAPDGSPLIAPAAAVPFLLQPAPGAGPQSHQGSEHSHGKHSSPGPTQHGVIPTEMPAPTGGPAPGSVTHGQPSGGPQLPSLSPHTGVSPDLPTANLPTGPTPSEHHPSIPSITHGPALPSTDNPTDSEHDSTHTRHPSLVPTTTPHEFGPSAPDAHFPSSGPTTNESIPYPTQGVGPTASAPETTDKPSVTSSMRHPETTTESTPTESEPSRTHSQQPDIPGLPGSEPHNHIPPGVPFVPTETPSHHEPHTQHHPIAWYGPPNDPTGEWAIAGEHHPMGESAATGLSSGVLPPQHAVFSDPGVVHPTPGLEHGVLYL